MLYWVSFDIRYAENRAVLKNAELKPGMQLAEASVISAFINEDEINCAS